MIVTMCGVGYLVFALLDASMLRRYLRASNADRVAIRLAAIARHFSVAALSASSSATTLSLGRSAFVLDVIFRKSDNPLFLPSPFEVYSLPLGGAHRSRLRALAMSGGIFTVAVGVTALTLACAELLWHLSQVRELPAARTARSGYWYWRSLHGTWTVRCLDCQCANDGTEVVYTDPVKGVAGQSAEGKGMCQLSRFDMLFALFTTRHPIISNGAEDAERRSESTRTWQQVLALGFGISTLAWASAMTIHERNESSVRLRADQSDLWLLTHSGVMLFSETAMVSAAFVAALAHIIVATSRATPGQLCNLW